MRNLSKAMLSLVFAIVLVVQLGAQTNSNYFVHEVIAGEYDLIKTVQDDTEIILRPDRIEILKKADALTGRHEVSTFLLFGNVNKVQPQGRELIQTSKERVSAIYNDVAAEYLKAEFIDVHKYTSIVYLNLYDGADLEVSLDNKGELVFNLIAHESTDDIPFDLKVWDFEAKSSLDGIVSNGVEISSESAGLSLVDGKIDFQKRKQSQAGYSFRLDIK